MQPANAETIYRALIFLTDGLARCLQNFNLPDWAVQKKNKDQLPGIGALDSHVSRRRAAQTRTAVHSQARLTLDRPAKQALRKLGDECQKEATKLQGRIALV